jgi:thimet oligopeptidase
MKFNLKLLFLAASLGAIGAHTYAYFSEDAINNYSGVTNINYFTELETTFNLTDAQIIERTAQTIERANKALNDIIAIPNDLKNFDNTLRALDRSTRELWAWPCAIAAQKYTHPDKSRRELADQQLIELSTWESKSFGNNKPLFEACEQAERNIDRSTLNAEQLYFLDEKMKGFRRAGLNLDEQTRNQLEQIRNELSKLGLQFNRNITEDQPTFTATAQELESMDAGFLEQLTKTDDGNYTLNVDRSVLFPILQHCKDANVRKKMWHASANKAYPQNIDVLHKIMAKRDELAHLLGYNSFTALNLEEKMAHNPETVQSFLDDTLHYAIKKANTEIAKIIADCPESVTISENGKLMPWDRLFIGQELKKREYNVDEMAMREYFPLEHTIEKLLNIYEQFLDIKLTQVACPKLWSDDLRIFEVRNNDDSKLRGHIILDPFPRLGKYGHACHLGMSPSLRTDDSFIPSIALVITNFPKPTASQPTRLTPLAASTFFHEFGHALHSVLGSTEFVGFAGTNVKHDFVELPSQMLEEWLLDPEILKMISQHYQTKEPMTDAMINNFIASQTIDTGIHTSRQICLGNISLKMYLEGADKDLQALYEQESARARPQFESVADDHMIASFGHLVGYSSGYYGYLWSKVYALDMFEKIKSVGLLNPEIGRKYRDEVIGKGGSVDPMVLIENFLGRKPNSKAFFKSQGLDV